MQIRINTKRSRINKTGYCFLIELWHIVSFSCRTAELKGAGLFAASLLGGMFCSMKRILSDFIINIEKTFSQNFEVDLILSSHPTMCVLITEAIASDQSR